MNISNTRTGFGDVVAKIQTIKNPLVKAHALEEYEKMHALGSHPTSIMDTLTRMGYFSNSNWRNQLTRFHAQTANNNAKRKILMDVYDRHGPVRYAHFRDRIPNGHQRIVTNMDAILRKRHQPFELKSIIHARVFETPHDENSLLTAVAQAHFFAKNGKFLEDPKDVEKTMFDLDKRMMNYAKKLRGKPPLSLNEKEKAIRLTIDQETGIVSDGMQLDVLSTVLESPIFVYVPSMNNGNNGFFRLVVRYGVEYMERNAKPLELLCSKGLQTSHYSVLYDAWTPGFIERKMVQSNRMQPNSRSNAQWIRENPLWSTEQAHIRPETQQTQQTQQNARPVAPYVAKPPFLGTNNDDGTSFGWVISLTVGLISSSLSAMARNFRR